MHQGFSGWAAEFGFALLLLVVCLIGLSVASVAAGMVLALIPAIGILVLNLLTAAGEYTSRYLSHFLVACLAYALLLSLFVHRRGSPAAKGSAFKSERMEIYLQFYAVLIVYILPTVLWESNRLMGYR